MEREKSAKFSLHFFLPLRDTGSDTLPLGECRPDQLLMANKYSIARSVRPAVTEKRQAGNC